VVADGFPLLDRLVWGADRNLQEKPLKICKREDVYVHIAECLNLWGFFRLASCAGRCLV